MSSVDSSAPPRLPFDQVVIAASDGRPARVLSAGEFLALPLDRRVQLILGRQVEFALRATPVDRTEALRSLRALMRA